MISTITAWIFNRLAGAISLYTAAATSRPPVCSCVKKQHLNWTEILVIDPHCLAHTAGRLERKKP